jgi:hypothetical protein
VVARVELAGGKAQFASGVGHSASVDTLDTTRRCTKKFPASLSHG